MSNVLHRGRYLELLDLQGWEYVKRNNNTGVVVVVAITDQAEILLVEQHRPPVQARVVELPAGLAGDHLGMEGEPMVEAAKRELVEETGFASASWTHLGDSPVSAGLTNEAVSFFLATDLERVGEGGGDASEDIEVHKVPLESLRAFLEEKNRSGVMVDAKIGSGLWLATPLLGDRFRA